MRISQISAKKLAQGVSGVAKAGIFGVVMAGLLVSSLAQAKDLYRWINKHGTKEYSHAISSDMVAQGYEVLDADSMHVIRIVEPQLSEEEYATKLQREREEAECHQAETQMLKSMDSRISNAQANLALAENQKLELEKEAANKDRAGELLESAFINNIARVDLQINTQRNEINKRNKDKRQAKLDFEEDRRVFKKRHCVTEVATR